MAERHAITREMAKRYAKAPKEQRAQLLAMSARTIDRLLAERRRRLRLKGRAMT